MDNKRRHLGFSQSGMSSLNVISGSDCLRGWRRSNLMLFPIYSPRSMGYWKKKIDSCIYCQQQIKRGVGSTHIQLRIMLCWLHFSPFFFLPFLFLLPRSEKKGQWAWSHLLCGHYQGHHLPAMKELWTFTGEHFLPTVWKTGPYWNKNKCSNQILAMWPLMIFFKVTSKTS